MVPITLLAPNAALATASLLYIGMVPVAGLVFWGIQTVPLYFLIEIFVPLSCGVVFIQTFVAASWAKLLGTVNDG